MKEQRMAEDAVSPVIGVMLMLVVTIIIAAVVSGFAGGLAASQETAPQLTMDVAIANTGYAGDSYILFDVKGTSEPIPTKDLKITTSWTAADGTRGGATVFAGEKNTNYGNPSSETTYNSPLGFGKGVQDKQGTSSSTYGTGQHFGNYTLVAGTTMKSSPVGGSWYGGYGYGGQGGDDRYNYREVTDQWHNGNRDGMMAILGENWNKLRPGDTVDVRITHVPSGKVIFTKSVGVRG